MTGLPAQRRVVEHLDAGIEGVEVGVDDRCRMRRPQRDRRWRRAIAEHALRLGLERLAIGARQAAERPQLDPRRRRRVRASSHVPATKPSMRKVGRTSAFLLKTAGRWSSAMTRPRCFGACESSRLSQRASRRGGASTSAPGRGADSRSSSVRPPSSRSSTTSSPSAATASRHTPIPPLPATDVGDEVVDAGRTEGGEVASRHVRMRLREVDLRPLGAEPVGRDRVPRAAVALAVVRHVDERHEGREVAPAVRTTIRRPAGATPARRGGRLGPTSAAMSRSSSSDDARALAQARRCATSCAAVIRRPSGESIGSAFSEQPPLVRRIGWQTANIGHRSAAAHDVDRDPHERAADDRPALERTGEVRPFARSRRGRRARPAAIRDAGPGASRGARRRPPALRAAIGSSRPWRGEGRAVERASSAPSIGAIGAARRGGG